MERPRVILSRFSLLPVTGERMPETTDPRQNYEYERSCMNLYMLEYQSEASSRAPQPRPPRPPHALRKV